MNRDEIVQKMGELIEEQLGTDDFGERLSGLYSTLEEEPPIEYEVKFEEWCARMHECYLKALLDTAIANWKEWRRMKIEEATKLGTKNKDQSQ